MCSICMVTVVLAIMQLDGDRRKNPRKRKKLIGPKKAKWSQQPLSALVLLKHPTYQRLYRLFLLFQQQLQTTTVRIDKSISDLTLRKFSKLYEILSIFQSTKLLVDLILKNNYFPLNDTLFYKIEANHFQFDVQKKLGWHFSLG